MNYELAKQLKDAGFPHKCIKHGGNDGYDEYCQYEEWFADGGGELCAPPLYELIEACGDELGSINKEIGISHSGRDCFTGRWYAIGQTLKGEGLIPEEAVAKLWLELNK